MFIDWLKVSQEFDHDLPVVSDIVTKTIDTITGEVLSSRQPSFKHEGSHSSRVQNPDSGPQGDSGRKPFEAEST